MEFPSSLTEPISIGRFFEISGATSKKDRMVMMRPSTVGPQPTRGFSVPGGGISPHTPIGGFIFAARASPISFNLAHSIFCSAVMSLTPSSAITRLANSLDCSPLGGLPPPPDCADARLAVNHDAAWIPAEIGDVVPNPAKRRHQVGHADVQ